MKKKKIARFTKGEKLLYTFTTFLFVLAILIEIFCGAGVSNLKMSIEKIQYKIDTQEKTNETLTMKVNELTSFDSIKDIITDMGLAYNNENIIIINK